MEGQHRSHVHFHASIGTDLINRCPYAVWTVAPLFRLTCALGTDRSALAP